MSRLRTDLPAFLSDIRLEHSIFALPFALLGMLMATRHQCDVGLREGVWPTAYELFWIVVAMVGTRTAAMGFNRVVDRQIDARNPRTATRPLAAGKAGLATYLAGIAVGVLLLVVAAWRLNPLAVRLAPVVLLVVFGYSYTKRVTVACHWFVGLSLAIAPLGAWVAIAAAIPAEPAPWLLALAVVCWVAGFDIIYATMDVEFDRAHRIRSLPARYGIAPALRAARACHAGMVAALVGVALTGPGLGWAFRLGVALAAGLLWWEHAIVRPDDLRRVNTAFFTLNGVLGVLLLVAGAVDLLWLTR